MDLNWNVLTDWFDRFDLHAFSVTKHRNNTKTAELQQIERDRTKAI